METRADINKNTWKLYRRPGWVGDASGVTISENEIRKCLVNFLYFYNEDIRNYQRLIKLTI